MSEPFIGQIMQVGFSYPPRGWQLCAGQIIAIQQNSALFALLGTTFGGNGQTTFALPDARGRAFVGVGQGPGLSNYTWGEVTGTEQNTLLISNMPAHNHTATFQGIQGATTASGTLAAVTTTTGAVNTPSAGAQLTTAPNAGAAQVKIYAPSGTGSNPVNLGGLDVQGGNFTPQGTVTVGVNGGNIPVNNIQPVLAVYTCIAMEGIFPSRN